MSFFVKEFLYAGILSHVCHAIVFNFKEVNLKFSFNFSIGATCINNLKKMNGTGTGAEMVWYACFTKYIHLYLALSIRFRFECAVILHHICSLKEKCHVFLVLDSLLNKSPKGLR